MNIKIDHLAHWSEYVPTIARWQHDHFGYLSPLGTLQQRKHRLLEATELNRLPIALVALSNENSLVGSATILATTLTHKHLTPWLSSVVVPSAHRGKGIASALSMRALEEAARLGFEELFLFTPHNESLYARLGWRTFEHAVHNGVPLAIMRRETPTSC
jgi:N-acetylglutamate synthase-like GNAT family acetyltransferase